MLVFTLEVGELLGDRSTDNGAGELINGCRITGGTRGDAVGGWRPTQVNSSTTMSRINAMQLDSDPDQNELQPLQSCTK